MHRGKLKWLDAAKGYGFIQPDDGGADLFLHLSKVAAADLPVMQQGTPVSYAIGRQGEKIFAQDVSIVAESKLTPPTLAHQHADDDFETEFEREWGLRRG